MSNEFDSAAYQQIWDKLVGYAQDVDTLFAQSAPNAINDGLNTPYADWIPGLANLIKTAGRKMLQALKWLWEKIMDLLEGVAAPLFMAQRAFEWSDAKGAFADISSAINPDLLLAPKEWKGDAADEYVKTVGSQRTAIGKMEEICETCRNHLIAAAIAGFVLYAGVASVVAQFLTAVAVELGLIAAGFTAAGGFAAFWATTGITAAELSAAAGVAVVFVGDQTKAWNDIDAAANNNSGFQKDPDSGAVNWPDPNTKYFDDASVDDDNESKWRLNPDK
ncbi:hypothetical protein [Nocardia xishanensis]|uniref:Uncharacterized protein n=1 Tax=Nocardia xishanensis TaxID=238964 RepID=A0ABW7XBR4_9NOCA